MHLPKSPNKKGETIQRLATKYKLRINLQESRGRPRKELNNEKKICLIEFRDRSDITYTNAGRKNHIYIGMFDCESKYKQKQYLLWPLREIVSIANGNNEVNESFESKFNKKINILATIRFP